MKELMGLMRDATDEEIKSVKDYIDSISETTYVFTDEEIKSHDRELQNKLIEEIYKWVEEQSRILKQQSDYYDDECFGGWRAMEAVLKYLHNMIINIEDK